VFVQISDENQHRARAVLDEVFGAENFCSIIVFTKTSGATSALLSTVADYVIWYARDIGQIRYRQLFLSKRPGEEGGTQYTWAEHPDGQRVNYNSPDRLYLAPEGSRVFAHGDMTSQRPPGDFPVEFEGQVFRPAPGLLEDRTGGHGAS